MKKEEARNKAREWLRNKENRFAMRPCWKCNACHKHLKKEEVLWCMVCGNWYYKGINITEKYHAIRTNSNQPRDIKTS